jgi:transposase
MPSAAQAAVVAVVTELKATIVARDGRIAALETRIADLEARLNQNSTNSSKPPSSDPPYSKPAPRRKPSGKRKGGQPGHPKRTRPRLSPDHIVDLKANACSGCGTPLSGDDTAPLSHQVIEIPPPPKPEVTEYRQHRLCCSQCHRINCPPLPSEACSGYGPRLQAIAALLSGAYRIGKRGVARLLHGLFGVPISSAAVCKLEQRTAHALAPITQEIWNHLVDKPANVDETSWREGTESVWLWTVVGRDATAFAIRSSRSRAVFQELIPGSPGLLTTDRLAVYDYLDKNKHQVCWAHLRRDFQAIIDRKDAGSAVGVGLLDCADRLLKHWKRVRDGTLSREEFQKGPLIELIGEVNTWLERGWNCGVKKTRNICYELLQLGQPLWRFAWVEDVEPTNNAAERALRHGVFWRKTSAGTDSTRGSRFVERILTVVESCRQQGRNLLNFLTDAIHAHRMCSARPSLVPVK